MKSDWVAVVCDQQLFAVLTLTPTEANVLGALVLGILHNLLEPSTHFGVHLSRELLSSLDHSAHQPRQLEMFESFERVVGIGNAELAVVPLTRGEQALE
jgi:hypothetical protein